MRKIFPLVAIGLLFAAAPVGAGIGYKVYPNNPCGATPFHFFFDVTDVNTDGSATGCANNVNAEMVITCTSKDVVNVDLAVELFSPDGSSFTPTPQASACAIPPGATATFVTNANVPGPWSDGAT